jgi:hypothetical protein
MRPAKILICHRPGDCEPEAAALAEEIHLRFGLRPRAVGGTMPPDDFAIAACAAMLVVLGRLGLDARDERGARRIDNAGDNLRLWLEAALVANRPLLVVLAEGAVLPPAEALPGCLAMLGTAGVTRVTVGAAGLQGVRLQLLQMIEEILAGRDSRFRPVQSPPLAAPTPSPPVPAPAEPAEPPAAASRGSLGASIGTWVEKVAQLGRKRPSAPTQDRAQPARAPRVQIEYDVEFQGAQKAPSAQPQPDTSAPPPRSEGMPPAVAAPAAGSGIAEPAPEPVLLGASAPQAVRPGAEFTARFVAYTKAFEAETSELLHRLSPHSTPQLGLQTCRWQLGTTVEVALSARGLNVAPARQQFTWEGGRNLVEFDVAVPENAQPDVTVLKFDVSVEGIVLARLRLDLEVSTGAGVEATPVTVRATPAHTAFASYSSHDRERVLDRVAAVRISAGLDIFLDCMSLHPSEAWKPQLEEEIKRRELFLLFWSSAASESQWVAWEWHTALRARGKDAIQVHPLEVGIKPPDELKDLHFGDPFMLAREAYRNESAPRP